MDIPVIITITGGLGLFLYGMKVMSESLQRANGDRMRKVLQKVTTNRLMGVLTGTTLTAVIQSSSATTLMLVSFVNAGIINLEQSIGIMYGANIGTTFTGWIVALFGFKVKITAFALPAIAAGFFIRFLKKEKLKDWGEVLVGFGILFLGINFMGDAAKGLRDSESVMRIMSAYRADSILSTAVIVAIGAAVTVVVQSSSATMAMTMTLAANGLIDFNTSCALILGENVGTTITAHLGSIGASDDSKRCAWAHVFFNFFGILWALLLFHNVFLPFVDLLVPGDPFTPDIALRSKVIADHMAAFHSLFNIFNTLLFLPLISFLIWITAKIIPYKENKQEEDMFHLMFISTSLVSIPSVSINEARLEIKRMCGITIEMFNSVMEIFNNPHSKMGRTVEDILRKENTVDMLEKEISTFLVRVSRENISEEQSYDISRLLHRTNEVERIGDHCEGLLRQIRKKYEATLEFSPRAEEEIAEISGKVRDFLTLIYDSMATTAPDIIPNANILENRINELRKELRKKHIERLNEGTCNVIPGLIYLDMLNSFEKIGDHSYNISEGISRKRIF